MKNNTTTTTITMTTVASIRPPKQTTKRRAFSSSISCRNRFFVSFLLLLSTAMISRFFSLVSAATSMNTCHSTLYKYRPNNCTKLVVPLDMCVACQVNTYLRDGQFADCSSTFNLQPPACIAKLQEYVDANPCDTHRKDGLEKYLGLHGPDKVEEGRQVMDFMVYALCEGGCDCIPQANANRNVPAISMERGNCQVHFYSDICTIYPDVQIIYPPGGLPSEWETWPKICPELQKFVLSSAANGWPTNPNVTVQPLVRTFLEKLLTATELLNPIVYQYCYDLETAQDRVTGVPYPTISPRPTPPPVTNAPSAAATLMPTSFVPNRANFVPVIRINCGVTNNYTDSFGNVWGPDVGWNTGKRYYAGGAAVYAVDPEIYKSDRWDPPALPKLRYRVNVVNGDISIFLVRLHFCELFFPNILSRIFDVSINGQVVIQDLDIVATANGWFKPLVYEFMVHTVSDGRIDITFDAVVENPKVNGIEILQLVMAPTNAPSPSPTLSPVIQPAPTLSLPTMVPSVKPIQQPSSSPISKAPTSRPSRAPVTNQPVLAVITAIPTSSTPSRAPVKSPTKQPSPSPTLSPVIQPVPTLSLPTMVPSVKPIQQPSSSPISKAPTSRPSLAPVTNQPVLAIVTAIPTSSSPSRAPVKSPTKQPTAAPTPSPTGSPIWLNTTINDSRVFNHEGCFVMGNNGMAYMIGGRTYTPVCEYNPELFQWNCNKQFPPILIHHMQCVAVGDEIWIPTSWTGFFPYENNVDLMFIYNTQTDTWRNKTGLPIGRRRGSAASIYYNGALYVSHGNTGGHASNATALRLLDKYDIATETWTPLPNASFTRDHTGGALVNGNLFCVAGGRNRALNQPRLQTECYDLVGNGGWSTRASLPSGAGRSGSAYGTTCDGKLIMAGGEGSGKAWDRVDVFNGTTWTQAVSLKQARHGTGLAISCSCGQIYIASGSPKQGGPPNGSAGLNTMETYFPRGDIVSCPVALSTKSPTKAPTNLNPQNPSAAPIRPPTSAPVSVPVPSPLPIPVPVPAPLPIPVPVPVPLPTAAPIVQPTPSAWVPLYRINAGGPSYTDSNGGTWVDQFFNLGTSISTTNSINMTNAGADETLYKTCRIDPRDGSAMWYRPVVETGKPYLVKLHFAELQMNAPGFRTFDVRVDGGLQLTNFDVFAETGGMYTAITRQFEVTSIRTYINIKFEQKIGEPFINAIEVFRKI